MRKANALQSNTFAAAIAAEKSVVPVGLAEVMRMCTLLFLATSVNCKMESEPKEVAEANTITPSSCNDRNKKSHLKELCHEEVLVKSWKETHRCLAIIRIGSNKYEVVREWFDKKMSKE